MDDKFIKPFVSDKLFSIKITVPSKDKFLGKINLLTVHSECQMFGLQVSLTDETRNFILKEADKMKCLSQLFFGLLRRNYVNNILLLKLLHNQWISYNKVDDFCPKKFSYKFYFHKIEIF